MTEISTVLALLDPINGTDPPVSEIDVQIENGEPFKTLDYLYAGFRSLHPPESLIVLTVNVLLGTVNMALTDIKYELLIISNPTRNAKLIIQGFISKSVQIGSVSFDINTEIHVPFQPYQHDVTDVPVIISSDFYIIEGGSMFILCDNTADLSMSRDILVSDGFLSTGNMDYQSSSVNLNIPFSTIFVVNFFSDLLTQANIDVNLFSHYMSANSQDIETLRATLQVIKSQVNYKTPPPPTIKKSGTLASKCDDFLSFVFDGKNVNNPQIRLAIASILSAGTLPVAYAVSWAFYKLLNCSSGVLSPSLDKKSRMTSFLGRSMVKQFMKSLNIDIKPYLQQEEGDMVTIQGPGTIEIIADGTVGVPSLSNRESIILNLNLVGIKPFSSDVQLDLSEYNLIQDNDSYNNSGSIFRRPRIITKTYTLSQFDGEVFLVDASAGNIVITIPVGDISKDRIMEFKRIDTSFSSVILASPGGIDLYKEYKLSIKVSKDGCKSKKLPYVRLFGDGTKLWLFK